MGSPSSTDGRAARPVKGPPAGHHLVGITPPEKMSLLASSALPSSCSGLMYWIVPLMDWSSVAVSDI